MCCWIISPFSDFCCFRCVTHCMSPLTSVLTDVLYIYICCFITITKFLCWSSIMNHLLFTAMKTLNLTYFGVTTFLGSWPFGVTWRHRSRDHWTRHMWFPNSGPLESCAYFAPLRRYGASKILVSRPWPFKVTWRHRSRDHRTRRGHFRIGGQ